MTPCIHWLRSSYTPRIAKVGVAAFCTIQQGWSGGSSPKLPPIGRKRTTTTDGRYRLVVAVGKQNMNLSIAAFKNVIKPDIIGPDWNLEITLQLLFPK
jgi:hypothetical protein